MSPVFLPQSHVYPGTNDLPYSANTVVVIYSVNTPVLGKLKLGARAVSNVLVWLHSLIRSIYPHIYRHVDID